LDCWPFTFISLTLSSQHWFHERYDRCGSLRGNLGQLAEEHCRWWRRGWSIIVNVVVIAFVIGRWRRMKW
jgi:hypothetical protein